MEPKHNSSIKALLKSVIMAVLFVAIPTSVLAHKVSIFAWVEGDTVYTLSKFSGGKMVRKGTVAVYDTVGDKLLEGLTDDRGEFSFKIPKTAALRVVLIAGAGHKNQWDLPLAEIEGRPAETAAGGTDAPPTAEESENTLFSTSDAASLQAAIEKALDKKLKPVMKLLAESKQSGPSLSEVLGGIGYIIGLVGIAAYFKRRREE